MRKRVDILALSLILAMAMIMTGCKKNEEEIISEVVVEESSKAPITTEETENTDKALTKDEILAKAPKSFEYAVRMSFGPDFVFYMAENGDVFAYEALNESAKRLDTEGRLTILGRSITDAAKSIIAAAAQDQLLKSDTEVKLTLLSTNQPESAAKELLFDLSGRIQESAKTSSLTIQPRIDIEQTVVFAPEPETSKTEESSEPIEEETSEDEDEDDLGDDDEDEEDEDEDVEDEDEDADEDEEDEEDVDEDEEDEEDEDEEDEEDLDGDEEDLDGDEEDPDEDEEESDGDGEDDEDEEDEDEEDADDEDDED